MTKKDTSKGKLEIALAPMLDVTNEHARFLLRLLNSQMTLFTEMVHVNAVLNHPDRFLSVKKMEHPIALQLGGSEASSLFKATKLALSSGFDEVNLNMGCPSSRVQSGSFGALLMKDSKHAKTLLEHMQRAKEDSKNPKARISAKLRIGVDNLEGKDWFFELIETLAQSGVSRFIIHARKAWLQGLSPKENRSIPPLDYSLVYELKKTHPHLDILINGGIVESNIKEQEGLVDGVMLGRSLAFDWRLAQRLQGGTSLSLEELSQQLFSYLEQQIQKKTPPRMVLKPWMGLFYERVGAKKVRLLLSSLASLPPSESSFQTIKESLKPFFSDKELHDSYC